MKDWFGTRKKFIIGMVHCQPLLGTPLFCGDMNTVIEKAVTDAETLEKAGVDAIIVENMGDQPFAVTMDVAQTAALAAVTATVRSKVSLPIGIDAAMNDCKSALSIAKSCGCQFVRVPVFVDTVVYYGGVIQPCAREAVFYRKAIGAEDIKIFADIQVKHSHMLLNSVTIEDSARSAVDCLADAIIVTGTRIGEETPIDLIRRVKKVVAIPVVAGSGVNKSNVTEQMEIADGAIIGSGFKEGGDLNKPISLSLTKEFMNTVKR